MVKFAGKKYSCINRCQYSGTSNGFYQNAGNSIRHIQYEFNREETISRKELQSILNEYESKSVFSLFFKEPRSNSIKGLNELLAANPQRHTFTRGAVIDALSDSGALSRRVEFLEQNTLELPHDPQGKATTGTDKTLDKVRDRFIEEYTISSQRRRRGPSGSA